MEQSIAEIRAVLQQFQDGYTARDVARLDEFMTLFAPDEGYRTDRNWGRQTRRHRMVRRSDGVNAFFSQVVRIQTERGHTVITTGPYRWVRHPAYVGSLLLLLGAPIMLSSWWALLPGLIAALLMIVRTALEDKTLQAELPGYQEFTEHTRYRLLPGVW